jgi:AraC family transcriptional activator FtrA
MSHGSLHRVVVIVDENSNPFELGCATEVFGLRRPELGRELYDFSSAPPPPGPGCATASSPWPGWPGSR